MFEYDRLDVFGSSVPSLDMQSSHAGLDILSKSPLGSVSQQNTQQPWFSSAKSVESGRSEEPSRRLSGGSTISYNDLLDCGASSGYGSPGFVGTPLASPAPNSTQYLANQLQRMLLDQGFCENTGAAPPIMACPKQVVCVMKSVSASSHPPTFVNRSQCKMPTVNHFATSPTREQQYRLLSPVFCHDEQQQQNLDAVKTHFALEETWNAFLESNSPPKTKQRNNEISVDSSRASSVTTRAFENSDTPTLSCERRSSSVSSNNVPPPAVEDGFSQNEIAQFAELLCSPKKAPPTRYQCHICYQTGHYISDCPLRFNSPYEELTPYQGRKKCYGEFQCQQCKRKWTSQNSVANEAQSCIKCHVPVFPHKQLPVDKAMALGLVKSQQRILPTKISPIGSGRPEQNVAPLNSQQRNVEFIPAPSLPISSTHQSSAPVAMAPAIGVGGANRFFS